MRHQGLQPILELVQGLFILGHQHQVPVPNFDDNLGQLGITGSGRLGLTLGIGTQWRTSRGSLWLRIRPGGITGGLRGRLIFRNRQLDKRLGEGSLVSRQLQFHFSLFEEGPRPLAGGPFLGRQFSVLVSVQVLEDELCQPLVPLHFVHDRRLLRFITCRSRFILAGHLGRRRKAEIGLSTIGCSSSTTGRTGRSGRPYAGLVGRGNSLFPDRPPVTCRRADTNRVATDRLQHSQQRVHIATAQRDTANRATTGSHRCPDGPLELSDHLLDLNDLFGTSPNDEVTRVGNHRRGTLDILGIESLQGGGQGGGILPDRDDRGRLGSPLSIKLADHPRDFLVLGPGRHHVDPARPTVLIDHGTGKEHVERLGDFHRVGRVDPVDLQVRLVVPLLVGERVRRVTGRHIDGLDRLADHAQLFWSGHRQQHVGPLVDRDGHRGVRRTTRRLAAPGGISSATAATSAATTAAATTPLLHHGCKTAKSTATAATSAAATPAAATTAPATAAATAGPTDVLHATGLETEQVTNHLLG